jgi:hypothetical protein
VRLLSSQRRVLSDAPRDETIEIDVELVFVPERN